MLLCYCVVKEDRTDIQGVINVSVQGVINVAVLLCSQGGWVVCEEDKDTLLAAWEEEVIEQQRKEADVSVIFSTANSQCYFHQCFDVNIDL